MALKIAQEGQPEGVWLRLEGRLDVATAPALEGRLQALLEEGHDRVVVELAGLDYVSSAGLRALLAGLRQLEARGGRLVLCGAAGYALEVFEVSGLDAVFTMVSTAAQAAEALGQAP